MSSAISHRSSSVPPSPSRLLVFVLCLFPTISTIIALNFSVPSIFSFLPPRSVLFLAIYCRFLFHASRLSTMSVVAPSPKFIQRRREGGKG
ncbi:hypothetical protein C8R45DRAFT_961289 [Mycena sanguinolenta]|nr:hypothetical protein C8R45DRAFT_961289 [Mycena sanguinolenta]